MQVDYNTYQNQHFSCPDCGWEGRGNELYDGDFSEYTFICNLECPKCSHLIALWQAPLTRKIQTVSAEGKINHCMSRLTTNSSHVEV